MKKVITRKQLNKIIAESVMDAMHGMKDAMGNFGVNVNDDLEDVNIQEISQKLYAAAESLQEIETYINGIENDDNNPGMGHKALNKFMWGDRDEIDYDEKNEFADDLIKLGQEISHIVYRLNELAEWADNLDPSEETKAANKAAFNDYMKKNGWAE